MAGRDELRDWLTRKRDMAEAGADATLSVAASENYRLVAQVYQDVLGKLDEIEHS